MIENDLKQLMSRDDAPLNGLSDDIWAREAAHIASQRSARRLAAWQLAVIAVAVVSSASFGVSQAVSSHPKQSALFAAAELAPSSLILGGKP